MGLDQVRQASKVLGPLLRKRGTSVAGLLDCLQAPDGTLQAQRQMALELRARTGEAPMSTLPLLLPPAERPELLAHWNTYYAKANGRLKPGQWYYQGKPMPAAPRETSARRSGARA